jgi:hypothetical protein
MKKNGRQGEKARGEEAMREKASLNQGGHLFE